MIFNLVHRVNDIPVYDWQRSVCREFGFRATVFIPSGKLNNPRYVDRCVEDRDGYGDEIALWLEPDEHSGCNFIWLLSEEDKERSVKRAIDDFESTFGYTPKTVGNYVLDSSLIRMIKEYRPAVTTVVAGCFEEGVKVFHGCNNSWYLFSEGMSWNPWYPSKTHSLRPAADEEDWAGVVAVPHLSRDLVFAYESRNDFFASHPANVQRGLGNLGATHDYDFNLCDQYRMQEDFNDGFSYYQMHVSSNWLSHSINVIDPDEITQQIYRETVAYLASLRDEGKVIPMTLSEFGEAYRKEVPLGKQTVGVGKDILMGSGKQYYWVFDTDYRVLIDTFQGGSIGDLRPYAGRYEAFTGVDVTNGRPHMNSYPYLIHSQYRTGYKHHCFDGSRTTLLIKHGDEELDLCAYNTKIETVERGEEGSTLTLAPVDVVFEDGLAVKLQTVYRFGGDGKIFITRKLLSVSDPEAEIEMREYVKGCYGFTEYPEDMKGIGLCLDGKQVRTYGYANRSTVKEGGKIASVTVPQVTTAFLLGTDGETVRAEVRDGHLFEPFYTMILTYAVTGRDKEVTSWLQIKKMVE